MDRSDAALVEFCDSLRLQRALRQLLVLVLVAFVERFCLDRVSLRLVIDNSLLMRLLPAPLCVRREVFPDFPKSRKIPMKMVVRLQTDYEETLLE